MRAAIVAPPWVPIPPPSYGGTEAVIDTLARGLQDAGHDVLLCATGDSTCPVPTSASRDDAAGTVAVGTPTEMHHIINAYDAIQEWGADVVHDHTLVGPVYARRFGAPVVTTNHGPFTGELGDYYRAISGATPIIALSEPHARSAEGVEIAAVIHHGIDVDDHPVGSGTGGYAVFLGRMCQDKGVHVAARIARKAGVPLKIAAKMREPAEHAYFDEQVAPLLGGDVEYIGEVGGRDKVDLLGGATCLLNPLLWAEPFGMVMIEALASGTPVVATPWGSVPDIVTDGVTGLIRSSEDELVEALQDVGVIDRQRCRSEACDRFSGTRMVRRHAELFAQVAERSTQRHSQANGSGRHDTNGKRAVTIPPASSFVVNLAPGSNVPVTDGASPRA